MSTERNPYLPPTSNSFEQFQGKKSAPPASKGLRFGTFLIDYLCFLGVSFGLGVGAMILFGQEGVERLKEIPDVVLGASILIIYYCFFEGIWGRTPGKFVLGTVVISATGSKPTFGQVLGRTLCRFIPFEAFSFLGSTGWHDSMSKTQVVRTRQS